jgi:hypothetical protein
MVQENFFISPGYPAQRAASPIPEMVKAHDLPAHPVLLRLLEPTHQRHHQRMLLDRLPDRYLMPFRPCKIGATLPAYYIARECLSLSAPPRSERPLRFASHRGMLLLHRCML